MNLRAVIVSGLVIGGVAGVSALVSGTLQPQRHAEALSCLEMIDGDWQNTCKVDLIAAYCVRAQNGSRPDDICVTQALSTGERFTNFPANLPDGGRYFMACKAPFVPAWKPTTHNRAQYRKSCRTPET